MKKVVKILVAISLVLSSLSRRDGRELRIFTFYFLTSKRQIALYSPCWLVGRLGGWLVSPLIFRLLYNKLEQKKNKDQNSNKRFALFTWSSLFTFPFRFFICFKPEESDMKQGKKGDKEAS